MDDDGIGLYAAGLSARDIRAHLEEVYGLRVSADLIISVSPMRSGGGFRLAKPGLRTYPSFPRRPAGQNPRCGPPG